MILPPFFPRSVRLALWALLLLNMAGWVSPAHAAQVVDQDSPDARLQEVRDAFEQGRFKPAGYLAETLDKDMRKKGLVSPALFELMGHIRYRQGELGPAALFYERAALFPPPIPEVRQNLTHIRSKNGSLVFAPHDVRVQLAAWLAPHQWMEIAIACGWVVLLSIVFTLLFLRAGGLRVLLLTFATFVFILGGLSLLVWSWHPTYENIKSLAIITAPDTKAYTSASTTGGTVNDLPPGSEVRTLDSRGAWTFVEIPGDTETTTNRGWVQTSALAAVWPEEYSAQFLE